MRNVYEISMLYLTFFSIVYIKSLPLRVRERALQDMRDSCLEQKKNLFLVLSFAHLVLVFRTFITECIYSPLLDI